MARTSKAYVNKRPKLEIVFVSSKTLGRCYYSSLYRVISTEVLDEKQIIALRDAGYLGYGQEFTWNFKPREDSAASALHPEHSGFDFVECIEVNYDDGVPTGKPALRDDGEPFAPKEMPYYVYDCVTRTDSGD